MLNDGEHTVALVKRVPRDKPVSGYVRMRMRQWQQDGKTLVDLAKAAGVAKSLPTQILGGLGVGGGSAAGFARAFGMTEFELLTAAHEWWEREGSKEEFFLASQPRPESEDTLAITLARHPGRWSVEVVRAAESAFFKGGKPNKGWEAFLDSMKELIENG